MKDRTLVFSGLLACCVHALVLFLNFDLSRNSLASTPPTIKVQLIAAPQPKRAPALAVAGGPAPASAPKKAVGFQPARPAKSKPAPEPKTVQMIVPKPVPMPEPSPSLEPQPASEPVGEVVIVDRSVSVATAAPTNSPSGGSATTGGAPGYGIGGSGGRDGVPGGRGRGGGPGGYGTGTVSSMPAYAFNPKPEYPPTARRDGQEGKTLLLVEVLPNGHAGRIKIEKSSGYKILDEAAIEAVKKWRFTPAKRGRGPVTAWARVPIDFSLED